MGAVEQTGAGSSASVGGIAAAYPAPGMEGGCFEAGYGGFVLLAVACVRWFFRWPAGEKQSLSSGGQFRGRMSSVMWGVLLAGVLTKVVVNGVVLASLLPMEPMVRQAKLLDTRGSRNGFNTWVLELEDGTRFDVEYAFLRSVPKSLVGQTVRIKIQENRLGYYVRPE